MDYYGSMRHDYIQKEMYPTEHRQDYFPPKPLTGSSVKIVPKEPCVPRFVSKIDGKAVEEGDRVYFEGILDAQPHPVFSWFFNDEPVVPGQPGWEDAEIHDSRKMSTLIIPYAREYHMGKYTLVAENPLGHAVSNADLIVRKKQFPPVFWQRLYNYEAESGSRLVAEVEVGGWPVPTVTWFKDDEVLTTKTHTENYNGFPNKYVPDGRIEVIRLDQIRHCIIFHRIGEGDSGVYSCQAVNPLGEAVCEAEFQIVPGEGGEGGEGGLYIPEKWKTGNRLDWAKEDQRIKPFVGVEDPGLSDEEKAAMLKRFAQPLSRAIEYLASLPDYHPPNPNPFETLTQVPFKAEPSHVMKGQKSGKPSRPSKFQPGSITHKGYVSDSGNRIMPWWPNSAFNIRFPNCPNSDPNNLAYGSVKPPTPCANPDPRGHRPDIEGPPGPPVWESAESIKQLYKLLDSVGCKLAVNLSNNKSDNKDQQPKTKPYVQVQAEARKAENVMKNTSKTKAAKQGFSYLDASQQTPAQTSTTPWGSKLDQNVPGAQMNAEDFTKQFMQDMYDGSAQAAGAGAAGAGVQATSLTSTQAATLAVAQQEQQLKQQQTAQQITQQQSQQVHQLTEENVSIHSHQSVDEHYEEMLQYAETHKMYEEQRSTQSHGVVLGSDKSSLPPALPPKTKIMFSPSRHLFSPSESVDDSDTTSVNTVEFVPDQVRSVKEKAKMIAQQQEEIVRREELRKRTGTEHSSSPHGGVRILPPSPVTVRKTQETQQHQEQQQHRVRFENDSESKQQKHIRQKAEEETKQLRLKAEEEAKQQYLKQKAETEALLKHEALLKQKVIQQQQTKQQIAAHQLSQQLSAVQQLEKSDSKSSQLSSDEVMYEATAQVTSAMSANTAQIVTTQQSSSQSSASTASASTMHHQSARIIPRLEDKYEISAGLDELVATETHSEASYASSVQQSSVSSRMTQQSAYSSMSANSSQSTVTGGGGAAVALPVQTGSETGTSVKMLKDSTYSSATSSMASGPTVASGGAAANVQDYNADRSSETASAPRGGNNTEKPTSDEKAWTREAGNPLWIRKGGAEGSQTPNFGSPMTRRKINQSPALSDSGQDTPSKYRTPPQTPFQPGFYKAPNQDTEAPNNPFPLSPKTARSQKVTKEKSSESIASSLQNSSSTSSISRKMRRKKREESRKLGPGPNASDSDNSDEEL